MNPEPLILAGAVVVSGLSVWWFLRQRADSKSGIATTESLIVGDVDAPLITVTPLLTPVTTATPLSNSAHLAAGLGPLLGRAPELLRLGQEMTTKTLRVVFSPEVTRGLQNGTLAHAQDAAKQLLPVARDARTGRFVEVGKAVKTGGVRLANVAAASWQIAAIVTAQHYLGEINARLQRLEDRVADIHFFQNEEKRAELRAAIHLLRQYHDAIARGELHASETAAIYQKLEDLEHTCLAIGELARELARRKMAELEKLEIREDMDRSGSAERAQAWVKQSQEAMELIFLAQSCRVLGCHVKAALPGDRTLLRERIAHAQSEIRAAVERLGGLHQSFHDKAIKPLGPRNGVLSLGGIFDSDYRPEMKRAFSDASNSATELTHQLDAQAALARRIAEQFDQLTVSGLALDVRLDAQGAVEILSVQPA